jgi:hypothetical protein
MKNTNLSTMGLVKKTTADARRAARASVIAAVAGAMDITPEDFNRRLASKQRRAFDSLSKRVYGEPMPMGPVFDPAEAATAAYEAIRLRRQTEPPNAGGKFEAARMVR